MIEVDLEKCELYDNGKCLNDSYNGYCAKNDCQIYCLLLENQELKQEIEELKQEVVEVRDYNEDWR